MKRQSYRLEMFNGTDWIPVSRPRRPLFRPDSPAPDARGDRAPGNVGTPLPFGAAVKRLQSLAFLARVYRFASQTLARDPDDAVAHRLLADSRSEAWDRFRVSERDLSQIETSRNETFQNETSHTGTYPI